MQLLSSSLLLLLAASSSLAGPCGGPRPCNAPVQTTIETFWETVTRTNIITVTEPSVPCDEEEEVTVSNDDRMKQLEKELAETMDRINALTTPEPCIPDTTEPEEVPVHEEEPTTPAADVQITRACTCEETTACRKESDAAMNDCMDECEQNCDDAMYAPIGCFKNNSAAIVEAENCLFKDINEYCTTTKKSCDKSEDKNVEVINQDDYTKIEYAANDDGELKNNALWKQHGAKYTKFQKFFQCTKNCMHRKFFACATTKECGIQMPSVANFSSKMAGCTKKNYKIAQSIVASCQCVAWRNDKVKELQGACVTIGNQYYIDRA